MRIDLHVGSLDSGRRAESAQRAERNRETNKAKETAQDDAKLSLDHARIGDLKSRVMAMPEVRADKVEHLRAAIADGGYQPPAEQVAEAMLAEWLGRR